MANNNEDIMLARMKLSCMEYFASKGWEYEAYDWGFRFKTDGVNYRLKYVSIDEEHYVASVTVGWIIKKGPTAERDKRAAYEAANAMNDSYVIGRTVYDPEDPDDDIFFSYEVPGLYATPQDFLRTVECTIVILDKLSDDGPKVFQECLEKSE